MAVFMFTIVLLSLIGMIILSEIKGDRIADNKAKDKRIIRELARIQLEEMFSEEQGYTFEGYHDDRNN